MGPKRRHEGSLKSRRMPLRVITFIKLLTASAKTHTDSECRPCALPPLTPRVPSKSCVFIRFLKHHTLSPAGRDRLTSCLPARCHPWEAAPAQCWTEERRAALQPSSFLSVCSPGGSRPPSGAGLPHVRSAAEHARPVRVCLSHHTVQCSTTVPLTISFLSILYFYSSLRMSYTFLFLCKSNNFC